MLSPARYIWQEVEHTFVNGLGLIDLGLNLRLIVEEIELEQAWFWPEPI